MKDNQGEGGMGGTIRLTAAQVMMRWPSVQQTEGGDRFVEVQTVAGLCPPLEGNRNLKD